MKGKQIGTNRQRKCQVLLSFELLLIYWKKINNQLKKKTEARLKRGQPQIHYSMCLLCSTYFFFFLSEITIFFRLVGGRTLLARVMIFLGKCCGFNHLEGLYSPHYPGISNKWLRLPFIKIISLNKDFILIHKAHFIKIIIFKIVALYIFLWWWLGK